MPQQSIASERGFINSRGRRWSLLKTERSLLAFLCQRVEVATARVQHTCPHQLIEGIKHAQPFFRLVAPGLEEYMQVQLILPHFSEQSENAQGEWLHRAPR